MMTIVEEQCDSTEELLCTVETYLASTKPLPLFSFCPRLLDIVNVVTVNSPFNHSGDCGHWVLSYMCLFLISLAGSNKEEECFI